MWICGVIMDISHALVGAALVVVEMVKAVRSASWVDGWVVGVAWGVWHAPQTFPAWLVSSPRRAEGWMVSRVVILRKGLGPRSRPHSLKWFWVSEKSRWVIQDMGIKRLGWPLDDCFTFTLRMRLHGSSNTSFARTRRMTETNLHYNLPGIYLRSILVDRRGNLETLILKPIHAAHPLSVLGSTTTG